MQPLTVQVAATAQVNRAKQGLPPSGIAEMQFGEIDCDKFRLVSKYEGVDTCPSIRLYSAGKLLKVYTGDGETDDLLSFAARISTEELKSDGKSFPVRYRP